MKQSPRKTAKPLQKGFQAPVKKSTPLKERATTMLGKVAKAMPKPIMNKLKGAMPAKLKDIKAKLKK